jgi:hypothetical protein
MEGMRLSILLVKDSAAFVCLFEAPSLNLDRFLGGGRLYMDYVYEKRKIPSV